MKARPPRRSLPLPSPLPATHRLKSPFGQCTMPHLAAGLPAGAGLAGLGVCSPGPLDHRTGVLIDPPNLPGWRNVPLKQMLSTRLNLPVCLEHDAKAADKYEDS